MRAWRSRGSCRTPEAPLAWCLQITRNEAIRQIGRRRKGLTATDPADLDAGFEDERAGGEADRALSRVDVERALGELTPAEQLLLALRYERDFSHPEIAKTLGISETAARIRLHRVHKRVKGLL